MNDYDRCPYGRGPAEHPGSFGGWYPFPAFLLGIGTGIFIMSIIFLISAVT